MKIIVPRKQLLEFRAQCRKAYPKETIAALFGVRTHDGVEVKSIQQIAHTGAQFEIDLKDRHVIRSKMAALRTGNDWLGTIHSHCDTKAEPLCWHMSPTDVKSALEYGEAICGIVFVDQQGHRSEVHWYIPAAPPVIEYNEQE